MKWKIHFETLSGKEFTAERFSYPVAYRLFHFIKNKLEREKEIILRAVITNFEA
jgi:hypothetical protein